MGRLSAARASDNRYVLLFEGHEDCTHSKHISRILDYTFIFCKETKVPVAIYCGAEIQDPEDVVTLIAELAEKYSLLGDLKGSPFFAGLAKALLEIDDTNILVG